jgi:uncharacterized linocin/CFP29 family protein
MDILKKSLAPVSDKAWNLINEQAKDTLSQALSARRFVDVDGPHGINHACVNLGRLNVPKNQKKGEVEYGLNQILPLTEIRMPFKLNIWELDNIERGAEDVNLDNLEEAAKKVAAFEDKAIYYGFKNGKIKGLAEVSENKKLACPQNSEEALCNIPEGITLLNNECIEPPYTLIMSPKKWQEISSYSKGYPLRRQLEELLGGGKIIMSSHVEGIILVSERGGDFKLTLGMDLSIGYNSHDNKEVELYFTESFTFQVIDPSAYVIFE